jgi:hypothetical protein
MEYTTLWQPITVIFVSFSMGVFFGSLWMFFAMNKSLKSIQRELDAKTHALNESRLNEKADI